MDKNYNILSNILFDSLWDNINKYNQYKVDYSQLNVSQCTKFHLSTFTELLNLNI